MTDGNGAGEAAADVDRRSLLERGLARFAEAFAAAERSFRALSPADREQIFETRLRIVLAREGETLEALLDRVGSTWDAAEAAAANAVAPTHRFAAGDLVKVTRRERYTPAR